MKLTSALCAAVVLVSSCASALNCYTPYAWCGWDLLEEGDYYSTIAAGLRAQGIPVNKHNINQSLWRCTNSDTGAISFMELCRGCKYGGNSQSNDYCGGRRSSKRALERLVADEDQ